MFRPFCSINIARGTTDPEIDSVTWTKFSYIPHGRICISCIFGHQTAPLAIVEEEKIGHNTTPFALVANLAHKMAPHALVPNLVS